MNKQIIALYDPKNAIKTQALQETLGLLTLNSFTEYHDFLAYFQKHGDAISIVIYVAESFPEDYQHIKTLKSLFFSPEFILLSSHRDVDFFINIVKLGIFSIHNSSVHPAILQLDFEQILSSSPFSKAHLSSQIKRIHDIDLFFLYSMAYTQHSDDLQSSALTHYNNQNLHASVQKIKQKLSETANTDSAQLLIIEDNMELSKTLVKFLKQQSFRCVCAYSAEEALQKMTDYSNFDLVLLDIGLKDSTGDTLIQKLQDIQPECSIVMLTGYKEPELLVSCIQNGAQDYITKPFIPSELLNCIEENIQLSQIKAASSESLLKSSR